MIITFPRSIEAAKKLDSTPGIQELNEEEIKGYDWIKLESRMCGPSLNIKHLTWQNIKNHDKQILGIKCKFITFVKYNILAIN